MINIRSRYPFRLLLCLVPLLLIVAALPSGGEELPERGKILELLNAGKEAEALEAAHEWTLTHPGLPEALILYATVQERNDEYAGALDSLDSAYFLSRDVTLLVRKGYVQMRAGQLAPAQRTFQEALRQQETCAAAHVGLALVMLEKQSPLEAAAAANCALTIDPHSVEALVALARLRLLEGKYPEAEALLQQALGQGKDAADPYLWLGRVCSDTGRAEEAVKHWRRYIELEPGTPTSWLLSQNLYPTAARPHACTGYYPAFSPDGKLLAFRGRGDATCLYLSDVNHPETFERIYQGPGTIYSLDWSPDSTKLLVRDYFQEMVENKPQYKYRLIIVSPTGEHEAKVVYEGRYVGAASWSRDGQSIMFDANFENKGRPILKLPATGGTPLIVMLPDKGESFTGCLSHPDGKRLLLQRYFATAKEYQLMLVDPVNRAQDKILARSPQSLYYMNLSPDGRFVFYFRRLGQPPTWQMMVLPLETLGPAHPAGMRMSYMLTPAVTPDMKHVLIYETAGMMLYDLHGVR